MKCHAREGNEFIHFSIRTIVTCEDCRRRGLRVMTIIEHPEDLGRVPGGFPASIWQIPELRKAYAEIPFMAVAGHQCRFNVDRAKPTRLLSDISSLVTFGQVGWPRLRDNDKYLGRLLGHCGHQRAQQTSGRLPNGGFATSPFRSVSGRHVLLPRLAHL